VLQDTVTINECLTFVRNENGKAEAIEGEHDDTVMALAIAYGIRHQQEVARPKPKEEKEVIPVYTAREISGSGGIRP
jgi:phage terminase large subunit